MKECSILWNDTRPHRVFINTDEFARLMEIADERDRVILLLGGAMGLRRDEIRKVRYTDIRDGRLRIHGKGHGPDGKVEEMRIPELVMSAIEEWTEIRNGNGMEDLSGGCIVVSYQKAGFSSYDGEFRLPLVLAQASPIFHSSCEGKLGIALE